MNTNVLYKLNSIYEDKLENFVCNHPDSNYFQSPNAFKFFVSTKNNTPLIIIAEENNEIVGCALAVIIKEGNGIKELLTRRCIIWGGPLAKDNCPEISRNLLKHLDKISSSKSIYSQFRNFTDKTTTKGIFASIGYAYEDHLNIIIDLTKTEKELWNDVYSKRRNEIRKAEKEGVSFKTADSIDEIKLSYGIIKEVYQKAKLPLPELEYFACAYEMMGDSHFKVFLALFDGKIIGTMYTLCYKDVIYDWYAGSYQEYYKKNPNDLLPWKVFLWGKENGFKKFDFGGAGKPNVPYGVREYKKKFGGEFVNYGRFEKINKPFLYQIAKIGFLVYRKFK